MVALGAAVAVITEILSAVHAIRPAPVTAVWIVLGVLGGAWLIRRERAGPKHIWSVTGVDALLLAGVTVIAGVVLFIALRSAPNSTDAMGYHLPRVVYWAQAGSVAFFPVHYYAQITMPPLAEYFVLHTFILSGGDHFANLVQFFGFIGSMLAVSLIARELGAHVRGQTIAVVLCATLPNAILQASGVKNDLLMSFWLVALPGLLFGNLSVLVPLRLSALGFSGAAIGSVFLCSAALEAGNNILIGHVSDRRGTAVPILAGLGASVLFALILPWPSSAVVLALVVVVASLAFGAFFTPALTLLTNVSEARGLDYGYAFALVNLAWAPGETIGSGGGGSVAHASADAVPYLALAGACALTLALAWRWRGSIAWTTQSGPESSDSSSPITGAA